MLHVRRSQFSPMIISCWNAQWHKSSSWKGARLVERLLLDDPEIVCCPEASTDFLPGEWKGIFSGPDYGYPLMPGRRKVTLWSRSGWYDIDDVGSPELPSGRFVSGTTETSLGRVRVIGVCVPWREAHVSNGNRNRQPWEDHSTYLHGLRKVLEGIPDLPTVIIGDFNQRLPRRRAPAMVHSQLLATLERFNIWTSGQIAGLSLQPVCHIGGSGHFSLVACHGYPRITEGKALSDHDGVAAEIHAAQPANTPME